MELWSLIHHWYLRNQKPIRESARQLDLSRNTIRKCLRRGEMEPKFKALNRLSKLNAFAERLAVWLRIDASKSRKQRRTAKQMHADLVALDYDGSCGSVAAFIRT